MILVSGALLLAFVVVPMRTDANAQTLQQIAALQESISVIVAAINGSDDITDAERSDLTSQLTTARTQLRLLESSLAPTVRTDWEVLIEGDIQAMTASATVQFNPEVVDGVSLGTTTSQFSYSFETTYTRNQLLPRARQLKRNALIALANDTGMNSYTLGRNAQASFSWFEDEDHREAYAEANDDSFESTLDLFGNFSVIEDVVFSTGDKSGFTPESMLEIFDDRGNAIVMAIRPQETPTCSSDDSPTTCLTRPPWEYTLHYYVNSLPESVNILLDEEEVEYNSSEFDFGWQRPYGNIGERLLLGPNAYTDDIALQLENILGDTGVEGIVTPQPELSEFVELLLPLLLEQEAYYFDDGTSMVNVDEPESRIDWLTDPRNDCHTDETRTMAWNMSYYFLVDSGWQLSKDLPNNFYVSVPYRNSDSSTSDGCINVDEEVFEDVEPATAAEIEFRTGVVIPPVGSQFEEEE